MKLGVFSKIFLCVFVAVSVFSFVDINNIEAFYPPGYENPTMPEGGTAKDLLPSMSNIAQGFSKGALDVVVYLTHGTLTVAQKVLGWVGVIFDTTIQETIVNVGDQLHFGDDNNPNSYNYNDIVLSIWKIFRDIGNIIIIFSLLYLAIRTILQGNGFADKKTLSSILIAAALINFSLFFTKLAFDVSNTVSVAIYSQIKGEGYADPNQPESQPGSPQYDNKKSLTSGIMEIINLQGLLTKLSHANDWSQLPNLLGQTLMFVVLCVILGLIFVSASIMLLYRFFVFVILMMVSPLGLVSGFVPWLSGYGKKWWEELKNQSVALPTFFIMFYIALFVAGTIFHGMADILKTDTDIFADTSAPLTAIGMYLVQFVILVMFLFAALVAPSYVGGAGSEIMSGAGKRLKGWGNNSLKWAKATAGTATLGTAAITARSGARLGAFASNKSGLTNIVKNRAQKEGRGILGINSVARKAMGAGDYIANKATYDPRNIKVGGKTIGDQTGLGKGIMGYKASVEHHKKEAEKKKKDEFELLGFKDMKADPVELMKAKVIKEKANKDVKDKEKVILELIKNDVNGSNKSLIEDEKKKLEVLINGKDGKGGLKEASNNFGRLSSLGESEYSKLNESRANRLYNRFTTKGEGMRQYSSGMKKGWVKDPTKSFQDTIKKLAESASKEKD